MLEVYREFLKNIDIYVLYLRIFEVVDFVIVLDIDVFVDIFSDF